MPPINKKWPMAVAAVVVIVIAGIALPMVDWDKVSDAVEEWTRPKPKVVQLGPTVLLVSTQERDAFLVKSTLEPRGFAVRVVNNAEAARGVLSEETAQIVVVVVDSALKGEKNLLQVSRSKCPKARLIELRGRREASEVSAVLVGAVSGT